MTKDRPVATSTIRTGRCGRGAGHGGHDESEASWRPRGKCKSSHTPHNTRQAWRRPMWRNLDRFRHIGRATSGCHIGRVPHRGATSGCHIGKKSSLLKMSQLDICVNSSVLHMHTDTPLGPRARPAAAEWAAGGDAAGLPASRPVYYP